MADSTRGGHPTAGIRVLKKAQESLEPPLLAEYLRASGPSSSESYREVLFVSLLGHLVFLALQLEM